MRAPFPRDPKRIALAAAAGALLGALSWGAARLFGVPQEPLPGFPRWIPVLFIGPAVEEIFFRGLLLWFLCRHMDERLAMILAAALFAVAHGAPVRMLFALPGGLLFGALMLKDRHILSPISAHIAANVVLCLLQAAV